jgi:hypothetical protein
VAGEHKPAAYWKDVMTQLLGPGRYHFSMDTVGDRALSAGETLNIFIPHFEGGLPSELGKRFDQERFRVGIEVCYCSTLVECWTLVAPARQPSRTEETPRCPARSESTFKQ